MTNANRLEELLALWESESERGRQIAAEELCRDYPDLLPEVRLQLEALQHMNRLVQHMNTASRTEDLSTASRNEGLSTASRNEKLVTPSARETIDFVPPAYPRIAGYQIEGELGRGAMGVVYKARDLKLSRLVALKMLLAGQGATAAQLERFQKEALALARLSHRHIVQIHAAGEHEGQPYLVLEFVAGPSLDKFLAGQPQPPRDAAHLVMLLARAVQAAHKEGIIHRDLKPSNVLLAPATDEPALNCVYGYPKISDFGLAKLLASESLGTESGTVLGTSAYMAPEQAEGQTAAIGPASDVWALGVILYQLLTGRLPFRGPTRMETMVQVVSAEPVPPHQVRPEVPADLEAICLKCLRKKPAERLASAEELTAELQRFLDQPPLHSTRPVQTPAPVQRRRWVGPVAAVAGVLVLATVLLWQPWQLFLNPGENTEGNGKGDTVSSNPPDKGRLPPAVEPLQVEAFQVLVHSRARNIRGWGLRQKGALPLRNGEQFQVQVKLNRPGYTYLLYLDNAGEVVPLYPWNRGYELTVENLKGLIPIPEPQEFVQSPAVPKGERARGWVMEGPSGLDTVVLLVSRTPLPAGAPLEAAIGKIGNRPFENGEELVVLGLNQDQPIPQFDQKRRQKKMAEVIDDEALQLCQRLQQTFQLDAVRLIGFAHQEK